MYNDIVEDPSMTKYLCCRNKPKRTKFINLSGPATCMCCGEPIYDEYANPRDEDCSAKVCHSCKQTACEVCNVVYQEEHHLMYKFPSRNSWRSLHVCEHDLDSVLYLPHYNYFILRNNLTSTKLMEISCNPQDLNYYPYDKHVEWIDHKEYLRVPSYFVGEFPYSMGWKWTETYSASEVQYFLMKNNISLVDLMRTTKTVVAKTMEDIDAYCRPLCD
jgi:hypothetical protein